MEINCILRKKSIISLWQKHSTSFPIHKSPSMEKTFVHKKQHLMQNNLNEFLAHDGLAEMSALNNGGIPELDCVPEEII